MEFHLILTVIPQYGEVLFRVRHSATATNMYLCKHRQLTQHNLEIQMYKFTYIILAEHGNVDALKHDMMSVLIKCNRTLQFQFMIVLSAKSQREICGKYAPK